MIVMKPPPGVPKLDAPLKFIVIGAPKKSTDASSSLRFFIDLNSNLKIYLEYQFVVVITLKI